MKTFYEFLMEMQEDLQPNQMQPNQMQTNQMQTNQMQPKIGADPTETNKLNNLKSKNYKSFVELLKNNANDEKFINFLQSGLQNQDGKNPNDDVINVNKTYIACKDLKPTQNEIDMVSSLNYPFTKPELIKEYINGGDITVGTPIVTCNGQYVIDGHHRWSQLYCFNPDAKISCLDFKNITQPIDALKITQLSIFANNNGKIVTKDVQGTNLIGINKDNQMLKDFIKEAMNKNSGSIEIFSDLMKSLPEDKILSIKKEIGIKENDQLSPINFAQYYIGKNVDVMNSNSQPIDGASERGYMPQTKSKDIESLEKGQINWKQEWKIMSGITIRD